MIDGLTIESRGIRERLTPAQTAAWEAFEGMAGRLRASGVDVTPIVVLRADDPGDPATTSTLRLVLEVGAA